MPNTATRRRKGGASRPVTLSDIARETGFHWTTVSQVLNENKHCFASEETRKVIREAAARLDYVPNHFARCLQHRRSHTVGVAGNLGMAGVTAATLKAISDGLTGRGYMPLFCECSLQPDGVARAARELRSRMVDGIILEAGGDAAQLAALFPKDFPVVLLRHAEVPGWPCVVADRKIAMARGVRRLVELGHRRIAFIASDIASSMRCAHNSQRLKIEGYREAMEALGLFDESLLIECAYLPGDVRTLVREQSSRFRSITAIMAGDDRIAVEAMSAMADIGLRVPEDVSVIGWNDSEFAPAVRPQLSSFQPQRAQVGAKAVEMLLKRIEGEEVETVTFIPELVVRESVAPCRR